MTIEERDLEILIALQENPLAPASKLAKAVNLSTPTVITRLELLKKDKSYYNVFADLIPEILGLEIIDVLIEIDKSDDLEYIEKEILYNHPYTLFRIRCYGSMNGVYAQFRIPLNSKKYLIDLLESLKKMNLIQNYIIPSILGEYQTVFTKVNLENWEEEMMRWNFDWQKWLSKLDSISPSEPIDLQQKQIIDKLDELDLLLLQELTMNARRKNTEIINSLKLDKNEIGLPQKISRKLKFINKNLISQFRVFLRWETFEIYNSFLILSECDELLSQKLHFLLQKHPIPFESIFKLTTSGFLWYFRCPASHFSNISSIIRNLSSKVNFYYLDYKKSQSFGLWKNAFDFSKKEWSKELMLSENLLK